MINYKLGETRVLQVEEEEKTIFGREVT